MADHPEHPSGYDKKDASIKSITVWTIASILVITIFAIGLNELFVLSKEEAYYEAVLKPVSEDLIKLESWEDSVLSSYELVDTANVKYRIPIDSAMKILLEEAQSN